MFKTPKLTALFMASSILATPAIADAENPFTDDIQADEIRYITTSAPEIQTACPQLQDIQLQEIPLTRIPVPKNTPDIYFSTEILFPEMQNRERLEEIDRFRFEALQADNADTLFISINSNGGSYDVSMPLAYDLLKTQGTIITSALDEAQSMGFYLLIAGSVDSRYVRTDSYLMAHEITNEDNSGTTFHEIDLAEGPEKEDLASTNAYMRQYVQYNSVTDITLECAAVLVQSKTDVQIMPEDAVRLGLVDFSIDWSNRTAMMRATP